MKAKDLMIGDWVYFEDKPIKIRNIYEEEINLKFNEFSGLVDDSIHESYIDPIPLTPEILEKNGFVREKVTYVPVLYVLYISYPIYTKASNIKASETVYIMFHDNHIGITISRIAGKMRQMDGAIKHIHELQHALRLCGIDKEITL